MARYLQRRLLGMIPTLLGITVFVFLILHLIPGDPVSMMMGRVSDPEVYQALKRQYGLDQPLVTQYFVWLSNVMRGNLGYSISTSQPVLEQIAERLPRTLYLLIGGVVVTLVLAVPTGILAAAKHNSWIDLGITTLTLMLMSIPSFWLAIMLILALAVQFKALPATGFVYPGEGFGDFLRHMVMPCLALGATEAALVARILRSSMLDALRQDYVNVARAKGARERRVLYLHALPNAAIPVVTVFALEIGYLLGGAIVIERVFAYPGMGLLLITAITTRDYPLIQGTILVFAVLFFLVNLLTDIVYTIIDPRIRYA